MKGRFDYRNYQVDSTTFGKQFSKKRLLQINLLEAVAQW